MKNLAWWIPFLLFAALASETAEASGAGVAAQVEALEREEKRLAAEQKEQFEALVREFLEKGIGPVALEAIAVLEALDPYNPAWGAFRAKARSLGKAQRGFLSWGKGKLKRSGKKAVGAWRKLQKKAQKANLHQSTRRLATIVVSLDPNEKKAREALGHVKVKKKWYPRFEADMVKLGLTFNEMWGYVTEEEKLKLEGGLRPRGRTWTSVEDEESQPRSWKEHVRFDDEYVILYTNAPYDQGLAFFFDLRKRFRRMEGTFGDFFRPPSKVWPFKAYLCRTAREMAKQTRKYNVSFDRVPVCYVDPWDHVLVARLDKDPWESKEKITVRDRILRGLTAWYLDTAAGDSDYSETPNAWLMMGLAGLAESRALFETKDVLPFGCFKDYLDARGAKRGKTIEKLLAITYKGGHSNWDEAQGAALCHWLLHGEGGRHRAKFLGLVLEFLVGDPSENHLPDMLKLTTKEIEQSLESYMKELLGK